MKMLPNEVYFDVFNFCTRLELASGISLVNRRFNRLAETKMFEEGEHEVEYLSIRKENDAADNLTVNSQKTNENVEPLPIPTVPTPKNITGFPEINIRNVHLWTPVEDVGLAIEFIDQIKGKMLNGGKYLFAVLEQFWEGGEGNLPETVQLRKLFASNLEMLLRAIGSEHFGALSSYRCDLDGFRDGIFDRLFNDPDRLSFLTNYFNRFDYYIYANSILDEIWIDASFWLKITPTNGHICRQMRLNFFSLGNLGIFGAHFGLFERIGSEIIDKFKQDFYESTTKWTFAIRLDTNGLHNFEQFHLVNEKTSECLKLIKKDEEEMSKEADEEDMKIDDKEQRKNVYYLLVRCPLEKLEHFSSIEIPFIRKVIRVDSNFLKIT